MQEGNGIVARRHIDRKRLGTLATDRIAKEHVVRQVLRGGHGRSHLEIGRGLDRQCLAPASAEPAIASGGVIEAAWVDGLEPGRHRVPQDERVVPVGAVGGRLRHGAAEVEAALEASEAAQHLLPFLDQPEVVLHVGQLVLPVAVVVGCEGHALRIEAVGEADEVGPDRECRLQLAAGSCQQSRVARAVEQSQGFGRELLPGVVAGEVGQDQEVGLAGQPFAMIGRQLTLRAPGRHVRWLRPSRRAGQRSRQASALRRHGLPAGSRPLRPDPRRSASRSAARPCRRRSARPG